MEKQPQYPVSNRVMSKHLQQALTEYGQRSYEYDRLRKQLDGMKGPLAAAHARMQSLMEVKEAVYEVERESQPKPAVKEAARNVPPSTPQVDHNLPLTPPQKRAAQKKAKAALKQIEKATSL